MRKITFLVALAMLFTWQVNAQFGCGSAVALTNGYTQSGITTPGTGGAEDWNTNPTGTSISGYYWDDDVYLFEYTAGATAEEISMTIFTRNSWNGIGIFDDCTGTTFSNELAASGSGSSNVSKTVSAIIAAGNTVYIAVGQYGTPNGLDFDVTSFTTTIITCPPPSAQGTTNVMATTADLYWTTGGASNWVVEYGPAGFTQGTGTTILATNDTLNITGLTAETTYDWYVRDFCGAGDSSTWVGANSFTTTPTCPVPTALTALNLAPTSADLGWTAGATETTWNVEWDTAGFTQGSGTMVSGTTTNPHSLSGLTANTSYDFYVQADCGSTPTTNLMISGVVDGPLTGGTKAIELYVISDIADLSIYGLGSANNGGGSDGVEFTFPAVAATAGSYIYVTNNAANFTSFFGFNADYVDAASTSINGDDAVELFENGTAIDVFGDINTDGTGQPWEYLDSWAYRMNEEEANNGTFDHTKWTYGGVDVLDPYTTNTAAGNDSVPVGSFTLTVQDTSTWAGPFTFTTPCVAVTAPYTEGFENGGTIPNCWRNSGAENWMFSNAPGSNHIGNSGTITGTTATGGYFAWVDASGTHANAILSSPLVDLTPLTTPALTFYELSHNEGNANSQLLVEVYDGANWNTVGTYNTNTAGWELKIIDLSGLTFTGAAQARFTFTEPTPGDFYDDIAIDDVSFVEMPSCFQPSALTASNFTATSADLGWTAGGTETTWNIEWDTTGFTQGTGAMISGTTTNPHSLAGLTANTSYDFYVQADCSGSTSTWAGPFTFTTPCAAFAVPFSEDFSTTSSTKSCWRVNNANADTDEWNLNYNSNPHVGDRVAAIYTDFNSGNNDDYLISPAITLTGNERLKFHERSQSTGEPNNYRVLISTTGIAPADFSTVLLTDTANTTTYDEHTIDLSSYTGNVYIAFHVPSGGLDGWRLYIDNVIVEAIPTCEYPTALTMSNLTPTSADLGWTAGGSETEWQIEYDTTGFTQGTGTFVVTTTNPHTLSGLTVETTYDFYVRGICGAGDTSAWAGPYTFFVGHCTPAPTSVDGIGITNVTMGTINNTTGAETNNYGNYYSMITDVEQGSTLNISITLATGYTYNLWAWVDWNNDLDFDDADEVFYLGESSAANPTTFTGSITVPSGATLGNRRIRIGGADNGLGSTPPSNPCYTGSYASFEDYTLNVIPCTPATGTDVQTACSSYTWIDGNTYTANNNTATDTIVGGAANGCDSIVTLDLTINMPTTGTDVQTACSSFTWIDGNTYAASNNTATHTITGGAANGCDSVVTLDLTINMPSTSVDAITACNEFTWIDGNTYTASNNTATHTLTNANGCDSVVTLNLTLNILAGDTNNDCVINNGEIAGDVNGDGVINNGEIAGDTNGDGTIGTGEVAGDANGDGVINNGEIAGDVDGNGTIEGTEIAGDANGNGSIDAGEVAGDLDGDGTIGAGELEGDANNNGTANDCHDFELLGTTVTYTVSVTEPSLSVSPAADAYQWINCADNSAIAGATAQSYTATANGSYAVVVTTGNCMDTLACSSITSIGIETTDFGILSIYPNPAKDKINVEFEDNATEASTISIINVLGQQVFVKENISDKTLEINTTEFADGVYYISIMSESRKVTQSFVIEK